MLVRFIKRMWKALGFHVHDWGKWEANCQTLNFWGGVSGTMYARKCKNENCGQVQTKSVSGLPI